MPGLRSCPAFQIADSQEGRLRRLEGAQRREVLRMTISPEDAREIAGWMPPRYGSPKHVGGRLCQRRMRRSVSGGRGTSGEMLDTHMHRKHPIDRRPLRSRGSVTEFKRNGHLWPWRPVPTEQPSGVRKQYWLLSSGEISRIQMLDAKPATWLHQPG